MGCDIHECVEKWNGTKWEATGDNLYDNRFYALFEVLAGVRAYFGFKIMTEDGGRGIPDDASAEFQEECEIYASDGHSHSYATFDEILAYDWAEAEKLYYSKRPSSPLGTAFEHFRRNVHLVLEKYPELPPEHLRFCFYFDN